MAINESDSIFCVSASQQAATFTFAIIESCDTIKRAIFSLKIESHHVFVGLLNTCNDLIIAAP